MARLVLSRNFWLLVCALGVAGILASGWLMQTRQPPALPETPPPQAEYYLRDAVVDVMDDSGEVSYRMRTSELLRYSDHSSELTEVQIESLGGEQGVWWLEAGKAWISQDQKHMQLSGGVQMLSTGVRGSTHMTTQTLRVELEEKRLNTDDSVLIKRADFEARAIGMQATFSSRNMTLLRQVRTRYAP